MDRQSLYRATLEYLFAPVADFLFRDEAITEVLINGPDQVFVERAGRLHRTDRSFVSADALLRAVTNLSEYVGRRIDETHHSLDARLPAPEQFRVHAIVPPASRTGIHVSIRKFNKKTKQLSDLTAMQTLTPMAVEYLEAMVRVHRNIVVSGGTGAGKTTLLNALSSAIDPRERIVVIEDTSEIQLQPDRHVVYLEAQGANAKGQGAVTIRDLFVDSLRMRPDRIIVGEVRRGEALDLVQSMLSGHDGAISTVHASSPLLALVRLETLCLLNQAQMPVYAARRQVASAIQVVVQIARLGNARRVTAISEVIGLDGQERYRLRPIFRFRGSGVDDSGNVRGELEPTGKPSRFQRELQLNGLTSAIELAAPIFAPARRTAHEN